MKPLTFEQAQEAVKANPELRYVFGTRTEKWYVVEKADRDWNCGFSYEDAWLNEDTALAIYCGASKL